MYVCMYVCKQNDTIEQSEQTHNMAVELISDPSAFQYFRNVK